MRIIAGRFKGRRLTSPRDARTTRPIPDRVKESLFSLLRGHFEGASVLDAFAGSGAIGIEALSRGASRCVFFEHDRRAYELLLKNVDHCISGHEHALEADVVRGDALGPALLSRCPKPVDLAFFDPPYALVRDLGGLERVRRQFGRVIDLLSDSGFAVLRTPWPMNHDKYVDEQGQTVVLEGEPEDDIPMSGHERRRTSPLPPHPATAPGRAGERAGSDGVRLGKVDRREFDRGRDGASIGGRGVGRRGGRGKPNNEPVEEVVWEMGTNSGEFDLDSLDLEGAGDERASGLIEESEQVIDGTGVLLPPGVRLVKVPVDLRFENADGPETHVYGTTAIHLYARKKAGA